MDFYRPNPDFEKELAQEDEFHQAFVEIANATLERAKAGAPHDTGHYAESFVVTEDGETVRLGNLDIAAHIIEWGSVNNGPFAPLRRGVLATGLRFEESPKP